MPRCPDAGRRSAVLAAALALLALPAAGETPAVTLSFYWTYQVCGRVRAASRPLPHWLPAACRQRPKCRRRRGAENSVVHCIADAVRRSLDAAGMLLRCEPQRARHCGTWRWWRATDRLRRRLRRTRQHAKSGEAAVATLHATTPARDEEVTQAGTDLCVPHFLRVRPSLSASSMPRSKAIMWQRCKAAANAGHSYGERLMARRSARPQVAGAPRQLASRTTISTR